MPDAPNQPMDVTPGDLAPREGPALADFGPGNKKLPELLQQQLRLLAKKFDDREMYARNWEVRQASKQRLFWQGYQHIVWNADKNTYQISTQGGGGTSTDADSTKQATLRQAYNIYLGYGKSFAAVFSQNAAATRFEPEDPNEGIDITASKAAEKMKRVITKFNSPPQLQIDIARFLWTDGRVVAYTRYVTDGQRFGFEDKPYPLEAQEGIGTQEGQPGQDQAGAQQRIAKGRELISIGGVLEWKVPIASTNVHEWPGCKQSKEYDITRIQAAFPDVADKINAGTQGNTDSQLARNARVATAEGTSILSQGGDLAHLATFDQYWFRPSFFYALEKETRDEMLGMFPDGCYVAFCGETYCESRNESMDDHISVLHALPGDGQNTPSLGNPLIPVQEAFNDMMNLSQEAYEYCIPATWVNQDAVDIDALQEQEAAFGAHYPASNPGTGMSMEDNFYTEPAQEPPATMVQFMENLQGPLAQFLTGQMPSLFGESDSHNETKGGIQMLRDQAMGLMGLIWMPFTVFWSNVMLQAVRCAANNRTNDVKTLVQNKTGKDEAVAVSIEDLKGNILCFPETDENFPESWTAKSNKYMMLMELGAQNPALEAILQHPDNLALGKDLIGLEDLTIPGADSRDKQLQEISQMLNEPPIANPPQEVAQNIHQIAEQATAAQVTGQPAPPPPDPSTLLASSSVPIDPLFDDHQVEFEECKRWINSPEGQKAKTDNNQGFMNVRLHALEHMKAMQPVAPPVMPMPAQGAPAAGAQPPAA